MKVRIMEVGPRDGLQNESKSLSIGQRLKFIEMLKSAGHSDIEVGAFVNPQRVPQMAGTKEILSALDQRKKSTRYWTLVPNERGYTDAVSSGATHIAIFTAASETFNQKNINTSIAGSFERFQAFVPQA